MGVLVKRPLLLPVPYFQQPNRYTCVPSCVKMLLGYIGFYVPISRVILGCGTDKDGTSSEDAIRFLRSLNLKPVLGENMGLSKITDLVARGYPVIVDVKDRLLNPSNPLKNNDEHVVVIVGFNTKRVYYLDPLRKRRPQSLTIVQFKKAYNAGERKSIYIRIAP